MSDKLLPLNHDTNGREFLTLHGTHNVWGYERQNEQGVTPSQWRRLPGSGQNTRRVQQNAAGNSLMELPAAGLTGKNFGAYATQ